MSKKLVCLLILSFAVSAQGGIGAVQWDGTISTDWGQMFNWSSGSVPVQADLQLDIPGTVETYNPTIGASTNAVINKMYIGNTGSSVTPTNATLTIYGSLTSDLFVSLGAEFNDVGTLNIDGGSLTIDAAKGGNVGRVGTGYMNLTNASVSAGFYYLAGRAYAVAAANSKGIVTMDDSTMTLLKVGSGLAVPGFKDGGYFGYAELWINDGSTVTTPTLKYDTAGTTGSFINFAGDGKLVLTGNQVGHANSALANGLFTGGVIGVHTSGGNTVVHLIPEPMTIALLGLGGLFIRRKK